LYCPPGVISNVHASQYDTAQQNLNTLNYDDDPVEYMAALRERFNIGQFEPIFLSINENGEDMYHLKRTTEHDFKLFLDISNTILEMIERNQTN